MRAIVEPDVSSPDEKSRGKFSHRDDTGNGFEAMHGIKWQHRDDSRKVALVRGEEVSAMW
jgi:hypothetical protein